MKITFLGATQEVTGSRSLVENENIKILIDCGLFQGRKENTIRNWDPFPVEPSTIDAIILTHAHIDHTGYIPVLIKQGFKGTVYCSRATYELSAILLVDSGTLQEEDAARANKYGYSSHHPALPLYTAHDAQRSLEYFKVVDFNEPINFNKSLQATLIPSYHILGASFVVISDGKKTLTFSGDLGQPDSLTMKAPTHLEYTDYLVLESTYGDRLHEEKDPFKELETIINTTVKRGGTVIIPSFAVGRTQTILYCLYQLKHKKIIPDIPIFLDSPMAINVSNLFCTFKDEHLLSTALCKDVFDIAIYTRTVQESKRINQVEGPAIIIAASGMAEGGRVLHHIKHFISDTKSTILFVGYQSRGTHGRRLVEGAREIKIYGQMYPVKAKIKTIDNFSAHADYNDTLDWLSHFKNKPTKIFLTHGEEEAAESLKEKIKRKFNWSVVIPQYEDSFELD